MRALFAHNEVLLVDVGAEHITSLQQTHVLGVGSFEWVDGIAGNGVGEVVENDEPTLVSDGVARDGDDFQTVSLEVGAVDAEIIEEEPFFGL